MLSQTDRKTSEEPVELSISIVTYNSASRIGALLDAIETERGQDNWEVLVTDNASEDDISAVAARHPRVHLSTLVENVYFTRADNLNLKRSRGQFVLSINPDCLPQLGAIRVLLQYLKANPSVGAVTPRFRYPDGCHQPSYGPFPSLPFGICEVSGLNRVLPWNRYQNEMFGQHKETTHETCCDVEVLYGACIMTRREVMDRVGLKDERFVQGWDEYDWCYRMRAAGWRCSYVPQALVVHVQGASRTIETSRTLRQLQTAGLLQIYRKYWGFWTYLLLRLCYWAQPVFMMRGPIRLIRWAVRIKPTGKRRTAVGCR